MMEKIKPSIDDLCFLIIMHQQGKIKIPDEELESIKEAASKAIQDFMSRQNPLLELVKRLK